MGPADYAPVAEPRVAILVHWLTAEERFAFEERAAICQYDGQATQSEAEIEALLEVLSQRGRQPVPAIRLFRLTLPNGASQWVLSGDQTQALACLHDLGGIDLTEEPPDAVLDQQFGGLAFLATTA